MKFLMEANQLNTLPIFSLIMKLCLWVTILITENRTLGAELIPAVNGAGKLLAVEWACVDDQSLLDELVTAQQFDEGIARSALFRWGLRHHFMLSISMF